MISIASAVSLELSLEPVTSLYTTCIVSPRPHVSRPLATVGDSVSASATAPLRKMPLALPTSVSTTVSMSITTAARPSPTYTVTLTVSAVCGFRFSSVSRTSK